MEARRSTRVRFRAARGGVPDSVVGGPSTSTSQLPTIVPRHHGFHNVSLSIQMTTQLQVRCIAIAFASSVLAISTGCIATGLPTTDSVTGAKLLPPNWSCARSCEPFKSSPAFPITDARHGLMLNYGGIGGTTIYRIDFDSAELSKLERASEATTTDRRDVILGSAQLATLREYADKIWGLPTRLPSERVGLDQAWGIRLSDGKVIRVETGLGSPGDVGHYLAAEIREIERALSPETPMVVERRRYLMSTCYAYVEPGHIVSPRINVRVMDDWFDYSDLQPTFPARELAGLQVHYPGTWRSCAN
jgi:hypothetical protein